MLTFYKELYILRTIYVDISRPSNSIINRIILNLSIVNYINFSYTCNFYYFSLSQKKKKNYNVILLFYYYFRIIFVLFSLRSKGLCLFHDGRKRTYLRTHFCGRRFFPVTPGFFLDWRASRFSFRKYLVRTTRRVLFESSWNKKVTIITGVLT